MAILQLSYRFIRTLSKTQLYSFTEIDKPILKLWKCKLPRIAKTTLIKKKLGGLTLFNFNYSVMENTPVSHLYYCLYSQNTSVFSMLLHCWSLNVQRFLPTTRQLCNTSKVSYIQFSSDISTWSLHQIPQARGWVHKTASPHTSDVSYKPRLLPVLLTN